MLLEMNWNSKELMKLNLICPSSPVTIQQSLTPLSSHSLSAPKRNNKYWPVVQLMENTFPRTRTRTSGPYSASQWLGLGVCYRCTRSRPAEGEWLATYVSFNSNWSFFHISLYPIRLPNSLRIPLILSIPERIESEPGLSFICFMHYVSFNLAYYVLYVLILIPFLWFPRTIEWTDHSIGSPISLDSLRKRMSSQAQDAI